MFQEFPMEVRNSQIFCFKIAKMTLKLETVTDSCLMPSSLCSNRSQGPETPQLKQQMRNTGINISAHWLGCPEEDPHTEQYFKLAYLSPAFYMNHH